MHPFVCDLIDELVDAFESDAFHAGMDEVFVLASEKCPRCRGGDPAEIFATAVNDLHGHLKKRGKEMMIWGDRLLDAGKTGYSEWDASANGTAPAIDMIPKDIVICDWHYSPRDEYPSIRILERKGFRVWPTTYSSLEGTRRFMAEARKDGGRKMMGVLTSIWMPVDRMTGAELPDSGIKVDDNQRRISSAAVTGMEEAWAGEAKDDPAILPDKRTFTDAVDVTMKKSGRGGEIRYTVDGSYPTASSPEYKGPIRLTESAVVTAVVSGEEGVSVRFARREYEKLAPMEPAKPGKVVPGLDYAAYLAAGMGWENMPDFSSLKPEKTGTTGYLDTGLASRGEKYGLAFSGYLKVPRDGLYTFTLGSDDGGQLFIGEKLVVDLDGLHPKIEKTGEAALKAGLHPIRVLFFQGGGNAVLELSWEGPGFRKREVPATALFRAP